MSTTLKYFSDFNGSHELKGGYTYVSPVAFELIFPGVKGIKHNGYMLCMGANEPGVGVDVRTPEFGLTRNVLPLTRRIEYKKNPSLHECDARCMGGRCNGKCECRCGGKNHGVASVR